MSRKLLCEKCRTIMKNQDKKYRQRNSDKIKKYRSEYYHKKEKMKDISRKNVLSPDDLNKYRFIVEELPDWDEDEKN